MTQAETLTTIERYSAEMNSSAAVKLTEAGSPILRTDDERKGKAAMQAHAISTRNEFSYGFSQVDTSHPPLPTVESFQSRLKDKPFTVEKPTPELAFQRISELAGIMANKITDETIFYSPFIGPNGQNVLTEYVLSNMSKLKTDLSSTTEQKADSDFEIFAEPQSAEIVDSVTRAFLYPSVAVIDALNDFDSGNCDIHSNTSFRRGDSGYIAARSGSMVFFMSDYGNYGWIDENHVAKDSNEVLFEPYEHFYIGSQPFFFTSGNEHHVILPGDTVYSFHNSIIMKVHHEDGDINWIKVPVPEEDVTEQLDFDSSEDLQTAITFLDKLSLPYMHSVFDCSEVLRRFFLLGGISLPKYSADMMTEIMKMSPKTDLIKESSQLSELADGVFVMNMINPANPPAKQSAHMFLVVKKGNDLNAFSYAFDIQGDEEFDHPMGPHVCGEEALTKQLEKGKQFLTSAIAA